MKSVKDKKHHRFKSSSSCDKYELLESVGGLLSLTKGIQLLIVEFLSFFYQ